MSTSNGSLVLRRGTGWSRGLGNVLQAEIGRWFRTSRWWIQILIWAGIINVVLALVILSEDSRDSAELVMLLNVFLGAFATFGVCILMQGTIVGEKQSGTAAWILSKPVSRSAFLLAKLAGNTLGVVVTILVAQGIIAYLLIYVGAATMLPPLGFLAGLGVQLVHLLFYLTLTLMLGALFHRRGPVIGLPAFFVFVQELLLGFFPVLAKVLPWSLTIPPDSGDYLPLATALMIGAEPLSYLPLVTTLSASVLFVGIALRVFERLEL